MGLTRRKKKRTHVSTDTGKKGGVGERANSILPDIKNKIPACFIIGRGQLNLYLQQLITDLKYVYEPNTASNLKTTKKNSLRDFLHVAGPLGVSHCIVLNFSGNSPTLRFARFPHGPTFTFKVLEYSLTRDVVTAQKRPKIIQDLHLNSPLLVLSQFTEQTLQENEGKSSTEPIDSNSVNQLTPRCLKLLATMLQNMFPSLNVHTVKLKQVKRCVIFHYDASTNQIHLRHYCIKASAQGIRKQVDRLSRYKIPSLSKYEDISEYLMKDNLSESEPEDLPEAQVILPQSLPGAGNLISQKSKIRLYELGPRLTLSLVKIQDSLFDGEVLYHMYIQKSTEEISYMRKEKSRLVNEKIRRRKLQESNVRRKQAEKELHRKRTLEGMRAHSIQANPDFSSDDDFEYYRREVGVEPGNELLLSKPKRAKYDLSDNHGNKQNFNDTSMNEKKEFSVNKNRNIFRRDGFKSREKNGFQTSKRTGFKHNQDDKGKFHGKRFQRGKFGNKFESRDKPNRGGKTPGGKVYRVRKKI